MYRRAHLVVHEFDSRGSRRRTSRHISSALFRSPESLDSERLDRKNGHEAEALSTLSGRYRGGRGRRRDGSLSHATLFQDASKAHARRAEERTTTTRFDERLDVGVDAGSNRERSCSLRDSSGLDELSELVKHDLRLSIIRVLRLRQYWNRLVHRSNHRPPLLNRDSEEP